MIRELPLRTWINFPADTVELLRYPHSVIVFRRDSEGQYYAARFQSTVSRYVDSSEEVKRIHTEVRTRLEEGDTGRLSTYLGMVSSNYSLSPDITSALAAGDGRYDPPDLTEQLQGMVIQLVENYVYAHPELLEESFTEGLTGRTSRGNGFLNPYIRQIPRHTAPSFTTVDPLMAVNISQYDCWASPPDLALMTAPSSVATPSPLAGGITAQVFNGRGVTVNPTQVSTLTSGTTTNATGASVSSLNQLMENIRDNLVIGPMEEVTNVSGARERMRARNRELLRNIEFRHQESSSLDESFRTAVFPTHRVSIPMPDLGPEENFRFSTIYNNTSGIRFNPTWELGANRELDEKILKMLAKKAIEYSDKYDTLAQDGSQFEKIDLSSIGVDPSAPASPPTKEPEPDPWTQLSLPL